jgi:cytochrome c biogenesis protein CcmG, thiol:disulfide interchange protein DsbE
VLVNVWASWCTPCRDELPLIEQAHKTLSARGGTVLGIDVKENSHAARKAVAKFGLSYPNLRDRDGDYVRQWGQTGYPETYVIDRKGKVAAVRRLPVTRQWLDRTLPPLLAEKA